jgi:hypothetical protein
MLDAHDNLMSSLKDIVDILADYLIPGLAPGRADSDSQLSFIYQQKKGRVREHSLKIEFNQNGR